MKITLICLCIVIAALMEVQVSAAEVEDSSALVKRNDNVSYERSKRAVQLYWKLDVPIVSCVMTIIPLPFSKHGKDLAYADLSTEVNFGVTIGNVIDSQLKSVLSIGKACRKALALSDTKAPGDTVALNLEIIDTLFNRNLNENNPFRLIVEKEHPELNETVRFSTDGFQCDEKFCKKYGDGIHGFGVCSPYSCSCSMNEFEARQCIGKLIFDPIYEGCDIPTKVKVCGF